MLRETSYRFAHSTQRRDDPELTMADRSLASGVSVVTQTSDGFVVLGKRAAAAGMDASKVHLVPAGSVNMPSLFDCADAELAEELGNVTAVFRYFLGIVMDAETGRPDFAVGYDLAQKKEDVIQLWAAAPDRAEHQELIFVPATRAELEEFLQSELGQRLVPIARVILTMFTSLL
jgi:hypothetical protein